VTASDSIGHKTHWSGIFTGEDTRSPGRRWCQSGCPMCQGFTSDRSQSDCAAYFGYAAAL
jgi:hypothetical protein